MSTITDFISGTTRVKKRLNSLEYYRKIMTIKVTLTLLCICGTINIIFTLFLPPEYNLAFIAGFEIFILITLMITCGLNTPQQKGRQDKAIFLLLLVITVGLLIYSFYSLEMFNQNIVQTIHAK